MVADLPKKFPISLSSARMWLAVASAVAIAVRLLTIFLYNPVAFGDSPSYRRLADTVLHGFANYDGTRTPGYPVFLALLGSNRLVWYAQLLLGLVTTLLLFYLGWKLTDRAWFGGVIALVHTLNLGQLFFESNLLTESLATFFVVLTMAGLLYWLSHPDKRTVWLAFSLGLVSTIALLVRPLFIYLPFITLLVLWLASRIELTPTPAENEANQNAAIRMGRLRWFQWHITTAFLLPVVLLLGGWVGFIHAQFGDWSLTTMTGYHLVQHTGNFFEYVPDEYATLRDIYIRYRDAHIAEYGTQTNTIWEAIPEMSQASGYSFYALSRVLTRISLHLILKHPLLYLHSAITGWWMFWRTPVYWSADALRFSWMVGGVQFAILGERLLLFITNLVFILASAIFVFTELYATLRHDSSKRIIHFDKPIPHLFFWVLLASIWIASIVQTLLDHGDNPRFLVPLQSLVVLWVAVFVLQLTTHLRQLRSSSAQR